MEISSFQELFSKLSSIDLFGKSSGSVVGIDVGSSAIKVVQLKKKNGRAVLQTYGELSLGPYGSTDVGRSTNLPVERLEEALRDILREANVTTKDAGLAIPIASSLISLVSMPTLPEKQMAEMIPLEARRYIPLPLTEVSLDWWVVPKEGGEAEAQTDTTLLPPSPGSPGQAPPGSAGKSDVLLVAVLNEAIQKYRRISTDLNFENTFFEIEIFSTIRSTLDHGITPVMVLDVGASSTKCYLVEHGVVKDSHVINRGSQDITLSLSKALNIPIARAEEMKRTAGLSLDPSNAQARETILLVLDHVFSEANRVLLAFEKRFQKSVGKVVLTGGGATMNEFLNTAKSRLQTEVVIADPFSKTISPVFLEKTLRQIGPDFAVAIGLALQKLHQS